jgi:chemotaxis receptor (MCP) glutamine deamidase CheD
MGSLKAPVDPENPLTALKHYMSGSHALEMMIVFLGLLLLGAGRYSLDHKLFGGGKPEDAQRGQGRNQSGVAG